MEHAPNEYFRNAVLTAPPQQLQLMLYDGAIRFTRQGIEGVKAKDFEAVYEGFSRAQKVILEMLNGLNYDVDRELCGRMAGLYNFVYRKLVEAGTQREALPAEDALRILEYQRETWCLLIEKLCEGEAGQSAPAPNAPTPAVPVRTPPSAPGTSHVLQPIVLADVSHGTLSVEG